MGIVCFRWPRFRSISSCITIICILFSCAAISFAQAPSTAELESLIAEAKDFYVKGQKANAKSSWNKVVAQAGTSKDQQILRADAMCFLSVLWPTSSQKDRDEKKIEILRAWQEAGLSNLQAGRRWFDIAKEIHRLRTDPFGNRKQQNIAEYHRREKLRKEREEKARLENLEKEKQKAQEELERQEAARKKKEAIAEAKRKLEEFKRTPQFKEKESNRRYKIARSFYLDSVKNDNPMALKVAVRHLEEIVQIYPDTTGAFLSQILLDKIKKGE